MHYYGNALTARVEDVDVFFSNTCLWKQENYPRLLLTVREFESS